MNINRHLVYNAVKCNYCQDIIRSWHRHDYVMCSCFRTATDGGSEYQRVMGDNLEILSVYSDEEFPKVRKYFSRYSNYARKYVSLEEMPIDWLDNISSYYLDWNEKEERVALMEGMQDWAMVLYLQEKLVKNEEEY